MNVLVITIDTLRWDHLGYNKQAPIHTPNIDRLAQWATVFDRCIIGSFPTVPHRMDCFTGKTCFPRFDWEPLPEGEITVTEVLREAGYHTAIVADTTNLIVANITRGMHEIHKTAQAPESNPKAEDMPFPVPAENIREGGKQRQGQVARMAHFKHESDWWVAKTMTRAAEWLEDNASRDKWFLWVDTFEVHEVWHTPQYYIDLYDANYEGLDYDFPNYGYTGIYTKKELRHMWARYAAEVTLTDRWIGHLLNQIDVMGLWDDTMVVLTSDHGIYLGEHKRAGKHTVAGDADPWPLYEEVSHVPLLVWIPGGEHKRRVGALAQPADLMATILDATRVKGPKIHGKSWLPLMTGKARRNWDVVYSSKHCAPKPRMATCPTFLTATTEKWTYIAGQDGHAPELYDIKADPKQKTNLARKHPGICKKLQQGVIEFLREQGAVEGYIDKF
jgi:arylsulfatase A-like enzyme